MGRGVGGVWRGVGGCGGGGGLGGCGGGMEGWAGVCHSTGRPKYPLTWSCSGAQAAAHESTVMGVASHSHAPSLLQEFQAALSKQAAADTHYNTYNRATGRGDTDPLPDDAGTPHTNRPSRDSPLSPFIKSVAAVSRLHRLGPSRLRHPDIPVEESVALKAQTRDLLSRPKFGPLCRAGTPCSPKDEVVRWLPGERPISHTHARQREALEQEMAGARQRVEPVLIDPLE